ncbi:MAG TPA: endonuclease/exonuclease/phosphatase family protein [Zeimonas sp.]|nr:endonuclease/exonuclease/phosphatase family protein [Zeimonas sp.]
MKTFVQRKAAQAKATRTRETARGTRPAQPQRRLVWAPRGTLQEATPQDDAQKGRCLRVSTYNIHKGVLRDFTGLRRVARIHELRARLHELDSDLIFLQEVQGQHQRYARRFAHWPAESQELFLSRSPSAQQAFQTAYGRNASYLHGHHGNALLSRFPIIGLENRDVSDHALEKRGVLRCTIDVGGRRVHCFVVHFGLLAASRERQLDALLEWIEGEVAPEEPLIVAGDFNDWRNTLSQRLCSSIGVVEVFDAVYPRAEALQRAAYFVRDRLAGVGALPPVQISRMPRMVRTARTYPALVPWFRMDRIYQRGFRVRSARVLRGLEWARLSDHSPLVADLELPEAGE